MTVREFLCQIQAYYEGTYGEVVCEYVTKWLRGKSPDFLDALFNEVILRHSRVYKCLPDVAIFEKYRAEAMEVLEAQRQRIAQRERPRIEAPVESDEMRAQAMALLESIYDTMRGKRLEIGDRG
jgi:hypothetical protein